MTALVLDLLLVSATVAIAAYSRSRLPIFSGGIGPGFSQSAHGPNLGQSIAFVAVPLVTAWLGVIALRGGYDRGVFGAGADEYKAVVNSSLITAALLGIGCYLSRFQLSRGFFLFAFVIVPVLLVAGRYVLRKSLHRARSHGAMAQRTIIVGGEDHVDAIASVLSRETWLGYDVVGALVPSVTSDATEGGISVLGDVAEAAALVRAYDADAVFRGRTV